MNVDSTATLLRSLEGRTITGLRRIMYVHADNPPSLDGPLEISASGDVVLTLDTASDGERLRVSDSRWVDPFAYPLSDENRRYLETAGRWSAFDISEDRDFGRVVGRRIWRIRLISTIDGDTCGVFLRTDHGVIRAEVDGDELDVDLESVPGAGGARS